MEGVEINDLLLPILIGLCTFLVVAVMEIKRNVRDLHKWHAPDDQGRQTWKWDIEKLIARIDALIQSIENQAK